MSAAWSQYVPERAELVDNYPILFARCEAFVLGTARSPGFAARLDGAKSRKRLKTGEFYLQISKDQVLD
jgi:hypothetical protein